MGSFSTMVKSWAWVCVNYWMSSVFVWVFYRFFIFLPLSKNMQVHELVMLYCSCVWMCIWMLPCDGLAFHPWWIPRLRPKSRVYHSDYVNYLHAVHASEVFFFFSEQNHPRWVFSKLHCVFQHKNLPLNPQNHEYKLWAKERNSNSIESITYRSC